MPYNRGDRVEVAKTEVGFEDSFFLVNVISPLSNGDYIIQFRTVLHDSGYGPRREIANENQLRPLPLEFMPVNFKEGDMVDANYRDGWWTGTVVRVVGSQYTVFFKAIGEEREFQLDELRLHQDYDNGIWLYSKK